MREQRGITLISLVVTIIILIILAGVSINLMLGDNGIITIARQAKENMEVAIEEEETELNELYSQIMIATNDSSQITISMADLNSLIDSKVQELREEMNTQINNLTEKNAELENSINTLNNSLEEVKNPTYSKTSITICSLISQQSYTYTMPEDAILSVESLASPSANTNGVTISINGIIRRVWSSHTVTYQETDKSTFEVKKGDTVKIIANDGATFSASYYPKE